jgi:hypothetical protein
MASSRPLYRSPKRKAGQLLSVVCVRDEKQAGCTRYGLASFRWFAAPSFLFGDASEE